MPLLVSIIMNYYNSDHFLREEIDSFYAQPINNCISNRRLLYV